MDILDSKIKFPSEINSERLNFLDVLVYKDVNKIEEDIYSKPTDSHNYVPFNSGHPRHVLRNTPYVLANQIIRIVSNENVKQKILEEMRIRLKNLGYPNKL